jgi:hypothetical protein
MTKDTWTVKLSRKAVKQVEDLKREHPKVYAKVLTLAKEIEISGPWRSNWPNYAPLHGMKDIFHCHVKSGKPTYVACWSIQDKEVKISEIFYVGTHEKAPY